MSATEAILGASGQVGGWLMAEARREGARVVGTYHRNAYEGLERLDLADPAAIDAFLDRHAPAVVWMPAFQANVEWVEENPAAARVMNVDGPLRLIGRLRGTRVPLVYYSTDYVFDGAAGPYDESAPVNPLSEYGRQKAEVERAILEALPAALVLRVTWVFGWERQGKNFALRARDTLSRGQRLVVAADQFGNPTYARNLAQASRELVRRGATGIFNLVGTTWCSRPDFARAIARAWGLDASLIDEVPTASMGMKAARPLQGGLRTDKARAILSTPLMDLDASLEHLKTEKGY